MVLIGYPIPDWIPQYSKQYNSERYWSCDCHCFLTPGVLIDGFLQLRDKNPYKQLIVDLYLIIITRIPEISRWKMEVDAVLNATIICCGIRIYNVVLYNQIYSGITCGSVLNGELYVQRLQKLIYLHFAAHPIMMSSNRLILLRWVVTCFENKDLNSLVIDYNRRSQLASFLIWMISLDRPGFFWSVFPTLG